MSLCQMIHSTEPIALKGLEGWRPTTVGLRFSISYLKLFEFKFKALEDPQTFDPNKPPVADVQPPVNVVPPGCDAVVQRHQLLTAPIPVILRLPHTLRYAPRQLLHFFTDLRGGPEQAFKGMSSKTRSTVLRKVRSYREFCGGEIRWAIYKTPEEMAVFHGLARQVARKTYQERLFDAGLPDTREFSNQTMELARRNSVRAFLLFHNEKPVAYLYTPAVDGFLVYDFLGYDPEYADRSPGTVLQYLALEWLYAEQTFPFYYWGFGFSQTKKIFSTGQVLGADIFYFRPTIRNRLAVRLHYGTDRAAETFGRWLDRLDLKRPIKRWLKRS